MNDADLVSRFVKISDANREEFVFKLPSTWWSRSYEYEWARQFAASEHVVLDAACGVEHPLKYWLSDQCEKCHACDLDPRLLDHEALIRDTVALYDGLSREDFPDRYLHSIDYQIAPLQSLPYQDRYFDRVFCISVLEHLNDYANRWTAVRWLGSFASWLPHQIQSSLDEFRRVLKDDGLIVLTFDFPRINLDYLQQAVSRAKLRFVGEVDVQLPQDALYWPAKQLYCFRAVLCRQ